MQAVEREGFWLELNLQRIDADALRRRVYRALIERLVPLLGALAAIILLGATLFLVHLLVHGASTIIDAAVKGLLATGTAGVAIAAVLRAVVFWRQPLAGSLTSLVHQPDYVSRWQEVVSEPAYSEVMRDPQYERRLGYLYLVQTDMKRVL